MRAAEDAMRFRLLPSDLAVPRWMPFAWLVYLCPFIVYAVMARPAAGWLTAHGIGLAAFLALYFLGYWLKGTKRALVVSGITAIGAVFIPLNPGASAFFIYAAGHVSDIGRARVAVRWLVAIVAVVAIETVWLRLPPWAWIPAALLSLIVGGANVAFADRRRSDERLRLARNEIEHLAKVAERERIARDLHDLLGHTLSVIVLKSELAAKLSEREPERATAEIRDVERISRDALAEVRRAVRGYRELTLAETLARAKQALAAAGVDLVVDVPALTLAPRTEGIASLVIRESVTNVIRHARATTCRITATAEGGMLTLRVSDDGVGGALTPGAGLEGMRTRLEEVGGRLDVGSDRGTEVRAALPMSPVPV
jgi:two-component system, NarL family, sensor histidine kinase DesK